MRWPARSFRWEGFASLSDLRNQLVGAVLMGFGGVTAMGCTVGQGMSGLSTLALGSFIARGRHRRRRGGHDEVHALARGLSPREVAGASVAGDGTNALRPG